MIRTNYIEGSVSGSSVDDTTFVKGGTEAPAFTSLLRLRLLALGQFAASQRRRCRIHPAVGLQWHAAHEPLDLGAYETQGVASGLWQPLTAP
jgi:hypothetical protein